MYFRQVAGLFIFIIVAPTSCEQKRTTSVAARPNETPAVSANIVGAGATLPARLYQAWVETFNTSSRGQTVVRYDAIGSSAGVQAFLTNKVDFGASDNALSSEERAFANNEVIELPSTGALVAIAFNLPKLQGLKLSKGTIAKIFSGQVAQWNDKAIQADNPQLVLPATSLIPVHRLDGSGTTHFFTKYLSTDAAWPAKLGVGRSIPWPSGVGAFGNEGVGVKIKHTEGSVGYVEYGVARQLRLSMAALETPDGFVEPNVAAGRQALLAIADGGSPGSAGAQHGYPMTTLSWFLLHKVPTDSTRAKPTVNFLRYALTEGQTVAESLGYIPLPSRLAQKALADLNDMPVH